MLITNLKNYPINGKHQECLINLPFKITKGEDQFYWNDKKGNEHKYNIFKNANKIDQRWIVFLKKDYCNPSLKKIFEIKVNKDLNKIIDYCFKIYQKSLKLELKRLKELKEEIS